MSECRYCFSQSREPHHPKCPIVDHSQIIGIDGALPVGTTLDHGRFLVGMALNRGGFGITYLCKDQQFVSKVALKEFFPEKYALRGVKTPNGLAYKTAERQKIIMMQKQFYREYQIMKKAAGKGVPSVSVFFQENNTAYISMDLVEGITFKQYLKDHQSDPLPWWELRRKFFLPLIQIVDGIHQKGILHRDISLVNVMITPEEKVTLLDFGAGRDLHEKDTVERLRFANRMYAPIEQTNPDLGYDQGPWTDIFAMGTVFYTAVTGHYPPKAAERPQKAVESAITYVPGLPEQLDDALMKSLYYYPKHRFQDVQSFGKALAATPDPVIRKTKPDLKEIMKNIFG